MIKNPVSKIFSPFAKPHMIKSTKMDPGPCVETLIKHQSTDIENRVIVTHVLLIESPLYRKPIVLKAIVLKAHGIEYLTMMLIFQDIVSMGRRA